MKKINLRGLQEVLSEKELKNVLGGSGNDHTSRLCKWGEVCDGTRMCWSSDIGDGHCNVDDKGDCYCKPDTA